MAALLMGSGGPAAAACYTGPFTGGYTNSGTTACIVVNNTSFSGTLGNSGTISPGSTPNGTGIAVTNNSTITGQITDSGVISTTGYGILVDSSSKVASASAAIRVSGPSFSGGISNGGTVSGSRGVLVYNASTFTGGISNSGTITASSRAIWVSSVGQFGNGGTSGGITNSGTISAGPLGVLLYKVSTFTGGIANTGSLTAGGNAIELSRIGQFGTGVASGGITNSGTISAGGHGILLFNVTTFAAAISNGGTISAGGAGIWVSNAAQLGVNTAGGGIVNSGTIKAAGTGIVVQASNSAANSLTFLGGITNSGTISANRNGIYGFNISVFEGGVNNSGLITSSTSYENAIELLHINTITGGITNSGTISAAGIAINVSTVSQFGSSASGGISNSGAISAGGEAAIFLNHVTTFTGGISNGGTISAAHNAIIVTSMSQFGSSTSGGITNTGAITAAAGNAIWVNQVSTFAGNVSNAGTISAGGIGIYLSHIGQFGGSTGGAVVNTGTITGGRGIWVENIATMGSGLTNAGTISVSRTGIVASNITISGGVSNTGTISAGGIGILGSSFSGGISNFGVISAGGVGIQLLDDSVFTGGINNSGTIAASAFFADGIVAFGIASFTGGITNSGAITVYSGATAAGILVSAVSLFTGSISNSGTIKVASTSAAAYGISVRQAASFIGGISNSGTISASGLGIFVGSVAQFGSSSAGGGITNSGTIAVTSTFSYGGGIVVSGASTFAGGISNSGTITVTSAGNIATGIVVAAVSTFTGGITNTGTISGLVGILATNSGAISIFDSGTIVGTGGTAIDLSGNAAGNTLTLGAGYSITGLVKGQGSDTLQLGGSGSANFDLSSIGTQYTGFTSFNVVSGFWNSTGTFGQTQTWNVNGGTLAGTGTFNSVNVNSGGTLAPGTPGVAGTVMTINGNLAFQSGAIYLVTVNGTSASHVNATGNVTLNGTLELVLLPGSYSGKTAYDILDPASISGRFTSVSVAGAPGLSGGLSYTTTGAFLNITANVGGSGGLIGNQQGVANAINTSFNNGGTLPASFFPVFSQTGSSLGNTLSQLSGESATSAGRGVNQLMTDFMELMLDPTAGGGGRVGSGGATGFAPEQDTSLPSDVALAYAQALKAPQAAAPLSFDQRWTAWGSAFGGASSINGNAAAGTNNVTASDYGFASGIDYHANPNTTFGFGLAGGGTNWNLAQGLGNGRSDSFQAGIYAKTHDGPFYLSGALAFANHWFTTDRVALGDQLQGKFTGQSYAARGEAGYRYALPVTGAIIGVTPYAALQVQDFHTPSYSETDLTGGGLGLSYASANATDTRSEFGARFDNLQIINGMPVVLRGRLAWAHDWYTNASALNAAFQALPGSNFTVNGAVQPQNSALVTAAAEMHITTNWTAIAKFDGEFASGAQTYGGTGTLRYSW
jgi:uncharacterized protein with beta-barrel porin domain